MSHNPSYQQNYPPTDESNPRWDLRSQYDSAPGARAEPVPRGTQSARHRLGAASGPHFGNFTGTQGYPTTQRDEGYPQTTNSGGTAESYYGAAPGPYSGEPQPSHHTSATHNNQYPTDNMIGTTANVGPGVGAWAGPPPGTGTGAPGYGTGAGTHQVDPSYGGQYNAMGAGPVPPGGKPGAQPSKVSRFIGEAEKIAGEVTNNPTLVQKGERRSMGGTRSVMGQGPHRGI